MVSAKWTRIVWTMPKGPNTVKYAVKSLYLYWSTECRDFENISQGQNIKFFATSLFI